jgi:hypothetical protein
MNHLSELDLALLAGGDAGRIRRFSLERHLRTCPECTAKMEEFRDFRTELADFADAPQFPAATWNSLAAEMRANIHLGLEAGACVGGVARHRDWTLRFAAAGACLLVLAGAGLFLRDSRVPQAAFARSASPSPDTELAVPMVASTTSGVELRSGSKSLTLLNQHGAVASQTVSAQGAVRSRYIDGETGSVTINNVYLD